MMRNWIRRGGTTLCGGCGKTIAAGVPLQTITKTGLNWVLQRCEACADSPCPLDLPQPASLSSVQASAQMQAIGQVAVQFRRPEKPTPTLVPKKRAYQGETMPVQGAMLDHLPRETRR